MKSVLLTLSIISTFSILSFAQTPNEKDSLSGVLVLSTNNHVAHQLNKDQTFLVSILNKNDTIHWKTPLKFDERLKLQEGSYRVIIENVKNDNCKTSTQNSLEMIDINILDSGMRFIFPNRCSCKRRKKKSRS